MVRIPYTYLLGLFSSKGLSGLPGRIIGISYHETDLISNVVGDQIEHGTHRVGLPRVEHYQESIFLSNRHNR